MCNKYIWVFILVSITLPIKAQDTLNIYTYPASSNFSEKVTSSVTSTDSGYFFNYILVNSSTSIQAIWTFHITVPVAEVSNILSPNGWRGRLATDARLDRKVRWMAADSSLFLKPGDRVSGFSFTSFGLPTITNYNARAWVDLPIAEVEPDSFMGAEQWRVGKKGFTIGPSQPPIPFAPLAFLDTLISYKHQAFDLGWIKNRGIVQSLDAKLENAKRQLQRNNRTAAKNMLQAFINEVEALWKEENQRRNPQGVQITSEAYALLKFNAEYLISKL